MKNLVNTRFVTRTLMGAREVRIPALCAHTPEPTVRPYASVARGPEHPFPDDRLACYGHGPVTVTNIRYAPRRFRYARVAFNYVLNN